MRRRLASISVCMLAALALATTVAACGEEATLEAVEGEPLELADLEYNIGLTRYLNPDDNQDAAYLVGLPPPEPGTAYLGVFLTIENHTDTERPSATGYEIVDTVENHYEALEVESPYALEVGREVPAEGELPLPDTTAEAGPNQGSLLVFRVDDESSENRPLELEINTHAGSGTVELDI